HTIFLRDWSSDVFSSDLCCRFPAPARCVPPGVSTSLSGSLPRRRSSPPSPRRGRPPHRRATTPSTRQTRGQPDSLPACPRPAVRPSLPASVSGRLPRCARPYLRSPDHPSLPRPVSIARKNRLPDCRQGVRATAGAGESVDVHREAGADGLELIACPIHHGLIAHVVQDVA